jgi:hypothetical protein
MGPLSFLKTVYDLDTLDTRFTSSSSTPYQTVIDARSDPAVANESPKKAKSRAEPSKWNTPEFYLYFVVIAWAIPFMFWVAYDVSRRECACGKTRDWYRALLTYIQHLTPDITSSSTGSSRDGSLDAGLICPTFNTGPFAGIYRTRRHCWSYIPC